jgi:hypothetical protein
MTGLGGSATGLGAAPDTNLRLSQGYADRVIVEVVFERSARRLDRDSQHCPDTYDGRERAVKIY